MYSFITLLKVYIFHKNVETNIVVIDLWKHSSSLVSEKLLKID